MGEVIPIEEAFSHSTDLRERIAYRIHQGSTIDLLKGVAELKLVDEFSRSQAAEHLADLIRNRIRAFGVVGLADVEEAVSAFHDEEVSQPDKDQEPVYYLFPDGDDAA